jgi:hypothetical protein
VGAVEIFPFTPCPLSFRTHQLRDEVWCSSFGASCFRTNWHFVFGIVVRSFAIFVLMNDGTDSPERVYKVLVQEDAAPPLGIRSNRAAIRYHFVSTIAPNELGPQLAKLIDEHLGKQGCSTSWWREAMGVVADDSEPASDDQPINRGPGLY